MSSLKFTTWIQLQRTLPVLDVLRSAPADQVFVELDILCLCENVRKTCWFTYHSPITWCCRTSSELLLLQMSAIFLACGETWQLLCLRPCIHVKLYLSKLLRLLWILVCFIVCDSSFFLLCCLLSLIVVHYACDCSFTWTMACTYMYSAHGQLH